MYKLLINYILLPIWEKYKYPNFRTHHAFLKRASLLSNEDIRKEQHAKLKKLTHHACSTVPYYKKLKIPICDISNSKSTEEILSLFPVLTRDLLKKNAKDLVTTNLTYAPSAYGTSSGTTGTPISFCKDSISESINKATMYFGWIQAGFEFGSKSTIIWGNRKTVTESWTTLSSRIKAFLFRENRIPACFLTLRYSGK